MKHDYERAVLVTEALYNARIALGLARCAAEGFENAPQGIDGLYSLCNDIEKTRNKFMRTVPDETGESINALVAAVEAERVDNDI